MGGLQNGAGSRDHKQGQLQGFRIGAKRLQIEAGISNWDSNYKSGKRDFKSGQGLQIGAERAASLLKSVVLSQSQ